LHGKAPNLANKNRIENLRGFRKQAKTSH
jgi:hypothetical protein